MRGKPMDRREFSKKMIIAGVSVRAGAAMGGATSAEGPSASYYEEPAKRLPVRSFDVVVAGGGTAGVVAARSAR
jgi:hypothetical protein